MQLYDEHDRATPRIQKAANRLTNFLGRPSSVASILAVVIVWMVGNYVASRLGYHPLEGFPFPDLAFFATVAAFMVAF
ncbi:hypothetical protein [Aureimonas leprariae]|uniref:hypothetical protein n=1 Tax=Plantimonas leprariae TaxID=2615207 RepID=UPI00192A455B|nr:hypothetical protein [Aureimonas leprariae]